MIISSRCYLILFLIPLNFSEDVDLIMSCVTQQQEKLKNVSAAWRQEKWNKKFMLIAFSFAQNIEVMSQRAQIPHEHLWHTDPCQYNASLPQPECKKRDLKSVWNATAFN